jgi:amidase
MRHSPESFIFHQEGLGEAKMWSRREALGALGAAAALASSLSGCESTAPPASTSELADPIHFSGVRALRDAIKAGEVSSVEVVGACLDRIEAVNGQLNAVFQIQREAALARAREADDALARGEVWGELHGIPMTIKDSLDTEGVITTGGTLGRASFVPERDATVVARLREQGAILMGKTNTPEFTLSFETDNRVYGMTNNPYDLDRSPGGSSGGAAAIIAAGGSPFDIGSDYGGSIRLPSHFCGIAGIKPTSGRVPRTGHVYPFGGIQDSFQQIGPLARSVEDLTLLLRLISGPDFVDPAVVPLPWRDPEAVDLGTLAVSFHTDNGIASPTAETVDTIGRVARALASEVQSVEEVRPTGIEQAWELTALYSWDGDAAVNRLLRAAGTTERALTPDPAVLGAVELDALLDRWYTWRSTMLGFFADYDVILCPVNATPARRHGPEMEDLVGFSYTFTYNLTGWPGAVVRAGTSPEGLPIGVQIVARPGREDVALAVARWVEGEFGGFQRPAL